MLDFRLDPEFTKKLKIRYVRKENFDKKGVMVAIIEDGFVKIGFSMCHKVDKWDFIKDRHVRNFGLSIAIERADIWLKPLRAVTIPQTIVKELKTFVSHLIEIYPEKKFPIWTKHLVGDHVE